MPYYREAEREIGVSGEVSSQAALGVEFDPGYVYPMHEMQQSYLDRVVAQDLNGMKVNLDGKDYDLCLSTFPQGRNGIPNEAYRAWNNGEVFRPVGAVTSHQAEEGERDDVAVHDRYVKSARMAGNNHRLQVWESTRDCRSGATAVDHEGTHGPRKGSGLSVCMIYLLRTNS